MEIREPIDAFCDDSDNQRYDDDFDSSDQDKEKSIEGINNEEDTLPYQITDNDHDDNDDTRYGVPTIHNHQ